MQSPFLERLERGVLIADGAIGTLLHDRGVPWGRSMEERNLSDRGLVSNLHVDYLRAGAELITTNTYSANRVRLAEHELEDRVRDINLHAVKILREAREIVGRPAFAMGAVGAIGRPLVEKRRDLGLLTDAYAEQIAALVEGGADLILLETFTDIDELRAAVAACRDTCDLPVIASMSFDADALVEDDTRWLRAVETLEGHADVIGLNCSVGPQGALRLLERMRPAVETPIAVMPNAGLPQRSGSNFLYMSTPEYFAEYARRFVDAGATIVGGCCGTTPAHVAAMAEALEGIVATPSPPRAPEIHVSERSLRAALPSAVAQPTRLAQALDAGEFVVSVELAPPKGINPAKLLQGVVMLEQTGLKFVNITDSAMARVRMGSIAIAKLVQDLTSLEAIVHYTTRDRNLMALQSELIGAHAMGVRNVLALTGDPPSVGDFPDATGVWDVESMGLVEVMVKMNLGQDLRGNEIGEPASFCPGAVVNPTAEDLEWELDRLWKKLDAGARYIMSQPLYDEETLLRFFERTGPLPVPFLLGVLPLQSQRHAEYMHNEVPGIEVPKAARDAMRKAGAQGIAAGIELSRQLIDQTQRHVQGIYLMPSFGRYEICARVLDALGPDLHPATAGSTTTAPKKVEA